MAEPINLAKQKAVERGLTATFLVMDALALKELPEVFDSAIDSGLFHVFGDEDRRRYVEGLTVLLVSLIGCHSPLIVPSMRRHLDLYPVPRSDLQQLVDLFFRR